MNTLNLKRKSGESVRRWTPEEVKVLSELVQQYTGENGQVQWKKAQAESPEAMKFLTEDAGRTFKNIMQFHHAQLVKARRKPKQAVVVHTQPAPVQESSSNRCPICGGPNNLSTAMVLMKLANILRALDAGMKLNQ